jgi:hypothetical protein
VVVWLLSAALRWEEPDAEGGGASSPPTIKLVGFSFDLDRSGLDLLLHRHHGGGNEDEIFVGAVLGRSTEGHPGAAHPRSISGWHGRPHLFFYYCDDLSSSWIRGDLQYPIQPASWVARLLLRLLQASPDLFLAPSYNLRREALFTLPFVGKDAAGDGGNCIAGEVGMGMRTRWRFEFYSRVLCANRKDMVVISFSFWSFLQYCKFFVY